MLIWHIRLVKAEIRWCIVVFRREVSRAPCRAVVGAVGHEVR